MTAIGNVSPVPPAGGGAIAGPFIIGDTSFGSLNVGSGTPIANTASAFVGDSVNGIGSVTLGGFGSNWTMNSTGADLTIGDAGIGTVTVTDAAAITVSDDTFLGTAVTALGRATVTGLGSLLSNGDDITIGGSGTGVLEIFKGGQVVSDAATLGANTTGQGHATVSGEFSRWRIGGTASIGTSGFGTINVTDGGRIASSASVTLASGSSGRGEVMIDGAGSWWNITGSLSTGLGDAYVTLANGGGVATTTPSTISTTGRVVLDGGRWDYSAADTNAISLFGLLEGSGTLDLPGVTNGLSNGVRGRLHTAAEDHLLLTGLLTNSGVVDLDGGELEVRGRATNSFRIDARQGAVLRVGDTGLANNANAQLSITGGRVDVFGPVANHTNAKIAVVGGATGVFHDAVTNNGTIFVSPGSEIVMLQNLGFSASSTLDVTLSDALTSDPTDSFGQAVTLGTATLAGTLNVALAPGYAPSLGDSFPVVSAGGGINGTFSTENLPSLMPGLDWNTMYDPNSLTLMIVAANLAGDFDSDGDADGFDFLMWQRGESPNPKSTADLIAWKTNFGPPTQLSANSATVPEPTAAGLTLLCLLVMGCWRIRGVE